jgi:hypothetical protein
MQRIMDPAVAAVEAVLRKAEGPFHALGRYYTNPDIADRQRRAAAERIVRTVDLARVEPLRALDATQLDLLSFEELRA